MSSKDLQTVGLDQPEDKDAIHTVSIDHASLPPRDYPQYRVMYTMLQLG